MQDRRGVWSRQRGRLRVGVLAGVLVTCVVAASIGSGASARVAPRAASTASCPPNEAGPVFNPDGGTGNCEPICNSPAWGGGGNPCLQPGKGGCPDGFDSSPGPPGYTQCVVDCGSPKSAGHSCQSSGEQQAELDTVCKNWARERPPDPAQVLKQRGIRLQFPAETPGTLVADLEGSSGGGVPIASDQPGSRAASSKNPHCLADSGSLGGGVPIASDQARARASAGARARCPAAKPGRRTTALGSLRKHFKRGAHKFAIPINKRGRSLLRTAERRHQRPCITISLTFIPDR